MFEKKSRRPAGTNCPPKWIQIANLDGPPQIQNTRMMPVDEKTSEKMPRSKKRVGERPYNSE